MATTARSMTVAVSKREMLAGLHLHRRRCRAPASLASSGAPSRNIADAAIGSLERCGMEWTTKAKTSSGQQAEGQDNNGAGGALQLPAGPSAVAAPTPEQRQMFIAARWEIATTPITTRTMATVCAEVPTVGKVIIRGRKRTSTTTNPDLPPGDCLLCNDCCSGVKAQFSICVP